MAFYKGIIKEVASGDQLVLVGFSKGGVPPEKRITLSSLIAPRLVRTDIHQSKSAARAIITIA